MTDQEISRRLALAIGYAQEDVDQAEGCTWVRRDIGGGWTQWRKFNYREPAVIFPIAERFDAFPVEQYSGGWFAMVRETSATGKAETAAKAVALAVIAAAEKGVLK